MFTNHPRNHLSLDVHYELTEWGDAFEDSDMFGGEIKRVIIVPDTLYNHIYLIGNDRVQWFQGWIGDDIPDEWHDWETEWTYSEKEKIHSSYKPVDDDSRLLSNYTSDVKNISYFSIDKAVDETKRIFVTWDEMKSLIVG